MGVVYRARDSQLGREVALKVLPEGFTQDPERLARFEREAKLLAQLNHPHIAHVYGLEASGERRALVMELVEGPTLAERLAQGALPVEESLSIARQIAEALEEAHEKGIVHRDLKPQNIKASVEGKVKVLDFGLAKAMDPLAGASGGASASQLAASPTLTLGATVQGMILGTAAYMAPEQARGTAVDHRADVWAFGVVLYEMLSGRTAFASETVPDTLAAVLTRELDWSALPASTPPAIRRLLRRCLTRKPKDRLHHIADARIVIEEVLRGEREETSAAAAPAAAAPAALPKWVVPALAAALALGVAGAWLLRPAPPAAPALRAALALPTDFLPITTDQPALAISPDGRRQLVLGSLGDGTSHLLLRDLDQVEPRYVDGSENAVAPAFSPDGESVVFARGSELVRLALAGGVPIRLASGTDGVDINFRGAAWSADGFVYYSPGAATALFRVSESGGTPQPVTVLDAERKERTHRWPAALPDGSAILFTSDTEESTEFYDDARIEAVRPATGERVVILEGSSQARFLPPDHLLFARGGTILATRFDPDTLTVSGPQIPLLQQVATDVPSGAVQFAVATTGAAIWLPGEAGSGKRRLDWVDGSGKSVPSELPVDRYAQLALSPDATRLAVTIIGPASTDLWIIDLERRTRSRLTFEGSVVDFAWSPDGRHVAYALSGDGTDVYRKLADGSGDAELLLGGPGEDYPCAFTPDGSALVVEHHETSGGDADLALLPIGGPLRPLLAEPWAELNAVISPDGRWIAYSSAENAAHNDVFVRRFPDLAGKWQVSIDGGSEPRWAPEGDAIYFRGGGQLRRVAVDTSRGFVTSAPETLVEVAARGATANTYAVARGGRVLVVQAEQAERRARQVHYDGDLAAAARRLLAPKR